MVNRFIEALIVGVLALIVLILIINKFGVLYFVIAGVIAVVAYAIYLRHLIKEDKKPVQVNEKKEGPELFISSAQGIPRLQRTQQIQQMVTKPEIIRPQVKQVVKPSIPKVSRPSIEVKPRTNEDTLREVSELEKRMKKLR